MSTTNKKAFTVFALQREEYKTECEYSHTEPDGTDVINETVIYTGQKPIFLGRDKGDLLNLNSIPAWKSKIIGEYTAEAGHTNKGAHKYLFDRSPITILN